MDEIATFHGLISKPLQPGVTSQDEDCPVEGLQEWLNDLRAKLGWVPGGSIPI